MSQYPWREALAEEMETLLNTIEVSKEFGKKVTLGLIVTEGVVGRGSKWCRFDGAANPRVCIYLAILMCSGLTGGEKVWYGGIKQKDRGGTGKTGCCKQNCGCVQSLLLARSLSLSMLSTFR